MRIAIVGAGISGLVAAHRLHPHHDVELFEANDYLGGHTNTVDIATPHGNYAVDTGFMVFNQRTYPNFIALLRELGIPTQDSDMSFSVRCERTGLEYCGSSLNTVFAQRKNLLRPAVYGMLLDVLRFNREAPKLLDDEQGTTLSLGDFLEQGRYRRNFIEHYLLPMTASIWSARPSDVLNFPARFLIQFFANHGLLQVANQPTWMTIPSGARSYVERVVSPLRDRVHVSTPVLSVQRESSGVALHLKRGDTLPFDAVVFATHADQTLRLLADADDLETDVLGSFAYQRNDAVLHTDASLLPRVPRARASWNYHLDEATDTSATLTYDLNRLQRLGSPAPICLTLNACDKVDPNTVLNEFTYHHPTYSERTSVAQARHTDVNGHRSSYYCGAYWGYGFHEDGVKSAMAATKPLLSTTSTSSGHAAHA